MEGGIGILLLFVILVLALVLGVAMYLTGGALWFAKTSPEGDRVEGGPEGEARPEHKRVDMPEEERVRLAGTAHGEGRERE
jgi:hypothetical protein